MQRDRQNKAINGNSKLRTYVSDEGSGHFRRALNKVEIICYDREIYVPQNLRRYVLDWYHFYLNHPCGGRPDQKIREV